MVISLQVFASTEHSCHCVQFTDVEAASWFSSPHGVTFWDPRDCGLSVSSLCVALPAPPGSGCSCGAVFSDVCAGPTW
jgi:hypothetical protein